MKISADTIARTICLFIAIINQILAVMGKEILPFTNDNIYQLVSLVFTIGTSMVSWWRNNSFTKEAIEADSIMRAAKAVRKK